MHTVLLSKLSYSPHHAHILTRFFRFCLDPSGGEVAVVAEGASSGGEGHSGEEGAGCHEHGGVLYVYRHASLHHKKRTDGFLDTAQAEQAKSIVAFVNENSMSASEWGACSSFSLLACSESSSPSSFKNCRLDQSLNGCS
jgi:hypothetical protein